MDTAEQKLIDTLLVASWIVSGSITVGIIGCSFYYCFCNADEDEFSQRS